MLDINKEKSTSVRKTGGTHVQTVIRKVMQMSTLIKNASIDFHATSASASVLLSFLLLGQNTWESQFTRRKSLFFLLLSIYGHLARVGVFGPVVAEEAPPSWQQASRGRVRFKAPYKAAPLLT